MYTTFKLAPQVLRRWSVINFMAHLQEHFSKATIFNSKTIITTKKSNNE